MRSPTAFVTAVTRKTSAARSLKIPFIPTMDAMASICISITSKMGPLVSDRTNSSARSHESNVSGLISQTAASGFSSMLRFVLLKNWWESAT